MSELFSIRNVPIFSSGTWNNDQYADRDLDSMVQAYGLVGFRPPLKLGHDESQPMAKADGMPALGWVTNLRRAGGKLYADLVDLPRKVYDAIRRKAYDRVSAEIYWDYEAEGKKHPRVLKALALLGAEVPAVTSLESLSSLYDASGKPFRRYDFDLGVMPSLAAPPAYDGMEDDDYKKDKAAVDYRHAAEDGVGGACGSCRFFQGPTDPDADDDYIGGCSLVSGEVASSWLCDLYEPREAFTAGKDMAGKTKAHQTGPPANPSLAPPNPQGTSGTMEPKHDIPAASVQKVGGEWCVFRGDVRMKCYSTQEEAERAAQLMIPGSGSGTGFGTVGGKNAQAMVPPRPRAEADALGPTARFSAEGPDNMHIPAGEGKSGKRAYEIQAGDGGMWCVQGNDGTRKCFADRAEAERHLQSMQNQDAMQGGTIMGKAFAAMPSVTRGEDGLWCVELDEGKTCFKTQAEAQAAAEHAAQQASPGNSGGASAKAPAPVSGAAGAGKTEGTDGIYFSAAYAVSEKPWVGDRSRYSAAQLLRAVPRAVAGWARAQAKKEKRDVNKDDLKLPFREPDGTVNMNGVRAALAAVGGARTGKKPGLPPEVLSAAKSELEGILARNKKPEAKKGADAQVPRAFTLTRDAVAELCPDCAERMAFLNLRELKITYDPAAKTYTGFSQGLCKHFGEAAGFRTRCMADKGKLSEAVDDLGAFCNDLKEYCFGSVTAGDEKKAADARPAKTANNDGAQGEGMTDEEKVQMEADLAAAQAEARQYKEKAEAAEAALVAKEEETRISGNAAWVRSLAEGEKPRILPAERPFVEYVLDALSLGPGATVKTYSLANGDGKTVELAPAQVFKKLFEDRKDFGGLFKEVSAGGEAPEAKAAATAAEEEGQRPSVIAAARAREYMKTNKVTDFRAAYRAVLDDDPDLKARVAGVRPEGAARQAAGAGAMSMQYADTRVAAQTR